MKAQYDAARILLGQKDYREALRIYLDIVHQFPKDGRAYQGLSQCYFGLRRFDDALSASNKAIQLDENLAMPHVVLAYVYHYWSDYDKALAEAHRAYALLPELDEVANCYGALLLGAGRRDESIAVLQRVLEIHPESELAHKNLALAYREKKDFPKYLEEAKLTYNYQRTLGAAIDLLIAYEQRYAFAWATLVIIFLLGAWLLKARILLVIPAISLSQNLYADLRFLIEGRWHRMGRWKILLFSLISDSAFAVIVYLIYRASGLK